MPLNKETISDKKNIHIYDNNTIVESMRIKPFFLSGFS